MKNGIFTIKLMLCGTGASDVYPFVWKCGTALQVMGAYNAVRNIMGHSFKEEEHEDLMATLLDRALGTDAAVFRGLVWFYIANEGLSILENLSLAGVPFPQRIRDALEQLRGKHDRADINQT